MSMSSSHERSDQGNAYGHEDLGFERWDRVAERRDVELLAGGERQEPLWLPPLPASPLPFFAMGAASSPQPTATKADRHVERIAHPQVRPIDGA